MMVAGAGEAKEESSGRREGLGIASMELMQSFIVRGRLHTTAQRRGGGLRGLRTVPPPGYEVQREGRLVFDTPRHKTVMKLPLDYPRINQFPEWFTVGASEGYQVEGLAGAGWRELMGDDLARGLEVKVPAKEARRILVKPAWPGHE